MYACISADASARPVQGNANWSLSAPWLHVKYTSNIVTFFVYACNEIARLVHTLHR
jgi:hypothetical protein